MNPIRAAPHSCYATITDGAVVAADEPLAVFARHPVVATCRCGRDCGMAGDHCGGAVGADSDVARQRHLAELALARLASNRAQCGDGARDDRLRDAAGAGRGLRSIVAQHYHLHGLSTGGEGTVAALRSSGTVLRRTLHLRIAWPLLSLLCALVFPPLAPLVAWWGQGHLLTIDSTDLALAIRGIPGVERIATMRQHSWHLLLSGATTGGLAAVLHHDRRDCTIAARELPRRQCAADKYQQTTFMM